MDRRAIWLSTYLQCGGPAGHRSRVRSSSVSADNRATVGAADGPGTGVPALGAHGQAGTPRWLATSRTTVTGGPLATSAARSVGTSSMCGRWTSSSRRATSCAPAELRTFSTARGIVVSAVGRLFSGPESSQQPWHRPMHKAMRAVWPTVHVRDEQPRRPSEWLEVLLVRAVRQHAAGTVPGFLGLRASAGERVGPSRSAGHGLRGAPLAPSKDYGS